MSAAEQHEQRLTAVPPGRVPPHSLDAERSVLGGLLLDGEAMTDLLEVLKPEDFYREAHRKIYEAMLALCQRNEPIDRVTVTDALRSMGALEAVGGESFIDILDTVVPSAASLMFYGRIVHDKALSRRLIEAAHAIAAQGYEQSGAVGEFLDEAERRIFSITEQKAQSAFYPVREIVKTAFKTIEALYERQEEITGLATGFTDLDRLTSGFQPGDLVILAARPSVGKTACSLNMATNAGLRSRIHGKGTAVGFFSLEMPKEQLVMRMLASEARVDSQRMRTGRLIESDWAKLAKAAGELANASIHIDDSPALTSLEVRAKARRLATKCAQTDAPLGLIVIDYLQLMRGVGSRKGESREQEVSEISRGLKALAKELGLPVMALSQLNRSLEKRPDKRPMMSDLRESGAIEADADTVLFIYRAEVYDKEETKDEDRGVAEIIIGKQRNGPTGTARLAFLHEFTRFENLGRDNRPHPAIVD